MAKYYRCGKILTTHGLKGDLKIQSFSDFDRFEPNRKVYIFHQEQYVEVTIVRSVPFGKNLLVRFQGMEDINLVEKYHGDELYIEESQREDLSENEYYYSDLIGKKVYNEHREFRGVVSEIRSLPACDYLYVSYQGKNYYIPFLDEFITEVSEDIEICELEGLMNEN